MGDYEDVPAKAHGGLTFANEELHDDIETDEDVIWFGFDCAHAGDRTRGTRTIRDDAHFWTKEEVVEETEDLAEQLANMTWTEIVEHKLSYMPNWLQERVEVADSGLNSGDNDRG